ncbi:SDR family NAD(P)-dependent oxidoreductase [Candidatus Omnitrophota bacterium]
MDLELKGKYALVTGGSRGIGRSIALALADEGCNVAICARNKDRLSKTADEIQAKKVECVSVAADAMKKKDIDNVIKNVVGSWGKITILVNNVGGGGRWGKEIAEDTEDQVWEDVYAKNAMAAVRFTKAVIPCMMKEKWGRVVTVASVHGKEAGGRPWFTMAKAAEISLMKTLAMDARYARNNITFNSVAPGAVMIPDTGWDTLQKENPDEFKRYVQQLPLGRLGTPQEVASLVTFLCSCQARLINGACIAVDGGESNSF